MKIFKMVIIILAILISLCLLLFSFPVKKQDVTWGVNFSQKHSKDMGLDWKENYSALITDLGVKEIKVASYWDLIESKEGKYEFDDLDWQIKQAQKNSVNVLLVIGRKTPRWPECHVPEWAKGLSKEDQQLRIEKLVEAIVKRYRDYSAVTMWQVENEPFFPFGECKWVDKSFLRKEIELVKSLDSQKRPVVISDSGEGSLWFQAASFGDIVGTTMYRKVWVWQLKTYVSYPLPPTFYWIKSQIIEKIFKKEVMCVELQAEPWGPELLYNSSLEEQAKTMNLEQFKKNIDFAKKTGLKNFYLWGSEWWYWMKENKKSPEIWEEAKTLFSGS